MLKTLFALVISTGLVACVTDDDTTVDTEELAEDADVLPDPTGNQVDPTGGNENPDDAPGNITAPNQSGTHVNIQNTMAETHDMNRADDRNNDNVVNGQSTEDLGFVRGSFEANHVGGENIGHACNGQDAGCRTINPTKAIY